MFCASFAPSEFSCVVLQSVLKCQRPEFVYHKGSGNQEDPAVWKTLMLASK